MMEFQTSHGFIQGSTHTVCEDYAISSHIHGADLSVPFNPLIIVSDGCSSADNSDVGARVVALAARKRFTLDIAHQFALPPGSLAALLETHIDLFTQSLDIPREWCVATLLAGFVLDGICHVYVFGDGVWYCRSKAGNLSYTVIEAADQSPPYLIGGSDSDMTITEYPSGDRVTNKERWFHWSFPADTVSEFGIATDGVTAVKTRDTTEVLEALTGDRVEYLINNFLDTHPYLYDDIGLAAIHIED